MSTKSVNHERLMQIILAPQISEKATFVAEKHNQIIFRVVQDATKAEIKAAVELIWNAQGISVENVRVANIKGKEKRFGRYIGRRGNWRKAYVSLKEGQEINFSEVPQGEAK